MWGHSTGHTHCINSGARSSSSAAAFDISRPALPPRLSPWRVLGLALAAQCGFSLLDQGLPTLTGYLKTDLGLSASTAGLAVSALAFGKFFGAYGAGVAADRLGERKVLVLGGLVAASLVVLAAVGPSALFFPFLFLAGVAGAAGTPAGGRLVLLRFPPKRRGLALWIRQTGIPLGGLVAAVLLPWVAHLAGWRWALVVASGVAALALIPLAVTRIELVDEPCLASFRRRLARRAIATSYCLRCGRA